MRGDEHRAQTLMMPGLGFCVYQLDLYCKIYSRHMQEVTTSTGEE